MLRRKILQFVLLSSELFLLCVTCHVARSSQEPILAVLPIDLRLVPVAAMGGDVNISNHDTATIENCDFNVTGKITAEENATIVIRNAKLIISPSDDDGISIVVKNQARLFMINSTVILDRATGDCQLVAQNQAEVNVVESRVTGRGFVIGYDTSTICVNQSKVRNEVFGIHSLGVVTYDASTVWVNDSTVDGVYVWENSTAYINRSAVALVRTTWTESDRTMLNIADCQIGAVETFGGTATFHIYNSTMEYAAYFHSNTYAWLESCSLPAVRATGNATVWLVDSSGEEISIDGSARVLVGLYLPFIGLVGVPYSSIPSMQWASMMAILLGVAAVSYAVYQKRRWKGADYREQIMPNA